MSDSEQGGAPEAGGRKARTASYLGAGLVIGVGVGAALDNIGLGIAIGIAMGAAFSAAGRA